MNNNYKFIHLLYVPTMNCNMRCKYCYLKENTVDLKQDDKYFADVQIAFEWDVINDVDININDIFENSTIETLSEAINNKKQYLN